MSEQPKVPLFQGKKLTCEDLRSLEDCLDNWLKTQFQPSAGQEIKLDAKSIEMLVATLRAWLWNFTDGHMLFSRGTHH